MRNRIALGVLLIFLACAPICRGEYVPIYGGFEYDDVIDTGYINPAATSAPGFAAGSATGIGFAQKYEAGVHLGARAMRWDATGAYELPVLGFSKTGQTQSYAYAANKAGTIVGSTQKWLANGAVIDGTRAVRWNPASGSLTELGHFSKPGFPTASEAYAINDAGIIAGYATKYNQTMNSLGQRAVRWEDPAGTTPTELGHIGTDANGTTYSHALAINNAGTTVGYARRHNASGQEVGNRAVRWGASGTIAAELGHLGTSLTGRTHSEAFAINNAGTAIGTAPKYDAQGNDLGDRAVLWHASSTEAVELQNLGTDANGVADTIAREINDSGTIVGSAYSYNYQGGGWGQRAVRWDASGTATILPHPVETEPPGGKHANAYGINSSGIIVGSASTGSFPSERAVMWGADGRPIDLNTLIEPDTGWTLLARATHISDDGWIAGTGRYDPDLDGPLGFYTRSFLLHVPEPSSGLAVLAVAGLLFCHRTKRHEVR